MMQIKTDPTKALKKISIPPEHAAVKSSHSLGATNVNACQPVVFLAAILAHSFVLWACEFSAKYTGDASFKILKTNSRMLKINI